MSSAQPTKPTSYGKPAPLTTLSSRPAQGAAALPHLDVLWHYDCVVSPRSHAIKSAAAKFQAGNRSISACSPLSRNHSDTASTPLADHRKHALQRVFNTFDENGDGQVSIHEISRIFEKLGIEYSMESLLASLVTKSEGDVDEQEFLSLYESICCSDASASSSSLQADVEQDLRDAFHVFDKDGNGFISPDELQSVLCSLGFPQGRQLEACVDMIARVDENGDGLVDFLEFKNLFHAENLFVSIPSY